MVTLARGLWLPVQGCVPLARDTGARGSCRRDSRGPLGLLEGSPEETALRAAGGSAGGFNPHGLTMPS